jgi:pyruvate dehydrogenase E2 component (dihydrolipoamide acetyltransferase)
VTSYSDVKLPQMGEGVHEATLIKWLKKIGEPVRKDEPILEVSTDKVDTEIVSPADGYLIAVIAEPGEMVNVSQALGQIADDPKAIVTLKAQAKAKPQASGLQRNQVKADHASIDLSKLSKQTTLTVDMPATFAGVVRSSPLVRKIAEDLNIDLREVRGSGLYGRITKEDVQAYMQEGQGQGKRVPLRVESKQTDEDRFKLLHPLYQQHTKVVDGNEYLDGVAVRREKMSHIRALTAEHMLRSVQISPHVTTTFEMDLQRIQAYKKDQESYFMQKHGVKLTYTPFFIYAAIIALKEHPRVNSSVDSDCILYKDDINIGCAVAIASGLIVPVIKKTQEMSFVEVVLAMQALVNRAHHKQLSPQDVQGGTFSITNPGMYGSLHSQPIINQPQVAIMSVGAIVKRPVVVDDAIVVHPLCQVGLTFDHRVIDGEGGAKFLATIKQTLENWAF